MFKCQLFVRIECSLFLRPDRCLHICPVTFSQYRESAFCGEFLSGATREIFSSTWTETSSPCWFFHLHKASPSEWLLLVSTERPDVCSRAALISHWGSTTFFCVTCEGYLTSLCLTFFICKMGKPSTSRVVVQLTYSPWLRAWFVNGL